MSLSRRKFLYLSCGTICSLAFNAYAKTVQPSAAEGVVMRYPHWTTHCVGRYLVSLPATATIKVEAKINKKSFEKLPNCTPQQLKIIVEKKVQELLNTPHATKGNMYIRNFSLPDNKGLLVQGWSSSDSEDASNVFIYIMPEYTISTAYYYKNLLSQDRENMALDLYTSIGTNLRLMRPDVIPTESGFCMGESILLDAPRLRKEDCLLRGKDLPDAPHLRFAFNTETIPFQPVWFMDDLNHNIEVTCRNIYSERCDVLRKSERRFGSQKAGELCVAGNNKDAHFRVYAFHWEVEGEVDNPMKPRLELNLLYTGPNLTTAPSPRPFSSDAEALAFWDHIMNSIRVRPVG